MKLDQSIKKSKNKHRLFALALAGSTSLTPAPAFATDWTNLGAGSSYDHIWCMN